ncbi:MAG: GNAT family N-acetyltransferase [Parvularculaceae bacterium]|nr:GNAT family N-acetyltransferase [Parvularculaceae bacterium]
MTPSRQQKANDIAHTEKNKRGRYWIETQAGEAELTYQVGDKGDLIVINSTFVPIDARGSGVALALVKRAIEDAKAQGRKIDPVCPYVDRLFDRHPEWRPLRAA